ncbi:MAG: LacI family DNA-binding transcriptional regulator [Pseudomonadota bacterium]
MAVTLKDVAERAGVSRSAVSRTYTEGASVSPKTRQKVERAALELGYSPNVLASSLTTGRTKLIGLVSNNFHNPIFLEVFDLFTRGLQERGLRPLLVNLSDEIDPEASIRMLKQYSVDAVIVASSTLPPSFAHGFQDAGVPVVHSFGRLSESPRVHTVGIDNIAAGRLAAETLLAHGYKRISMMAGPEGATSTQDRVRGFLDAAGERAHVSVSYASQYSFDAGRKEMLRLLSGERAEAYFCGDDVLSIGALSAAQSLGLKVPNDLGFIGLNDMKMAGWENIDLTTIHNPIAEIVKTSIALVGELLSGSSLQPQAHLLECSVVERGTLSP